MPGAERRMDIEDCPQARCIYLGHGHCRKEKPTESAAGVDGSSKGRVTLNA